MGQLHQIIKIKNNTRNLPIYSGCIYITQLQLCIIIILTVIMLQYNNISSWIITYNFVPVDEILMKSTNLLDQL